MSTDNACVEVFRKRDGGLKNGKQKQEKNETTQW